MARELARFRASARRRLRRVLGGLAAAATLLLLLQRYGDHLGAWHRGEIDLQGEPLFDPPHEVPEGHFEQVDLERVHAELVPAWILARARPPRSGNAGTPSLELRELEDALSADANLRGLFEELDSRMVENPLGEARRLDWLFWAWNDYLDRRGAPYRLEAALHLPRGRRPIFSTRSYRVLADARNPDGHRVRLLKRLDATNVVEGFLGHTARAEDGALVALDRVLHFTTHQIWPSLHPGLTARLEPTLRAFAPAVREEAKKAISPSHFALLEETAVDQLALIEVADSIHERHRCGSRFRVWGLPYNGLPPGDRRALARALEHPGDPECPSVTIDEAARMVGASERLGSTQGIEEAIEALATWVARGVVSHELRHVADGNLAPECPACPEGLRPGAREELSAYLASFAARGTAHVNLLQACQLPAGATSPHQQAMTWVRDRLLPAGCDGGPPPDLIGRATRLGRALYGRRLVVRLPEDLPSSLVLLPRRTGPRWATPR